MLHYWLRVFHAQCLRAMSRVTRKHTWEHRIASMQFMQELGLDVDSTRLTSTSRAVNCAGWDT